MRLHRLLKKYHVKPKRLLDVGCGHGLFLASAKNFLIETVGVDYQSQATHYARDQFGLNIIEGDFRSLSDEGSLPEKHFDIITSWHCLEHDRDPLAYMKGITKLLTTDGKVLIAVPNVRTPGMKIMREDWVWCQQPYVHVFHFTEKSIALLARKSGLKVISIWTRDTWDAHLAFDSYVLPRVMRLAKRLHYFGHWPAFWFVECSRLACYAATCYKHWLLGKERTDMHGSELLMLAEREDI